MYSNVCREAINATQIYTQYCTNEATFDDDVAYITVDTPIGLTMSVGSTLKVCFAKDLQNASAIRRVYLTYGGIGAYIKSTRASSTIYLEGHEFTAGNYDNTKPYKVWDAYTTLELMWTGSAWLVMGNPVLCSYTSSSDSYTVYANGLIEQRYYFITSGTGTFTHNLYVVYKSANYTILRNSVFKNTSGSAPGYYCVVKSRSQDSFELFQSDFSARAELVYCYGY
jgi:hypothetical protein